LRGASIAEDTSEKTVKASASTPKMRIGRYWTTEFRFYHVTALPGTSAPLVRGPGGGPTMPS
jgi:hypothetical protein